MSGRIWIKGLLYQPRAWLMMVEWPTKRCSLGERPVVRRQYTEHEATVLQVLALVFSCVSIGSTVLTFYWFLTMRRSFRHHLIMILIQSDMFKASWLMIYAIAALKPGSIESASTFCQISGFFTTAALELSDFAVLMIAVHSALYIFNPPTSIGEGGLYPYRYIAYFLWITLPFLLASLAFINPKGAYVSGGTSCHLPVRPFWYRLALSWVPRYLIFITILATDLAIYIYVRKKFGNLRTNTFARPAQVEDSHERYQPHNRPGNGNQRPSTPSTPPLSYHGLIPDATRPSTISRTGTNRPDSSERQQSRLKPFSASCFLKWKNKSSIYSNVSIASCTIEASEAIKTPGFDATATASAPSAALALVSFVPSSQSSWANFAGQFSSPTPSGVSVPPFLRQTQRCTSYSSGQSVQLPQLELVDSEGHNLNEVDLTQTHSIVNQQLRFLFVYPLAYMAMWALPFVSHVLQYNDYYAASPPFGLSAVNTVIIISQSTVDCWIFNLKERPWGRSIKNQGSLFRGLARLKGLECGLKRRVFGAGGGKSKGAMQEEARFAYQRRDEERVARASEIESTGRNERRERSWWDDIDDVTETRNVLAESSVTALADRAIPAANDRSHPQLSGEGMQSNTGRCIII